MWEGEKLLVTSNFSISNSVLKRLVLQTCKNQGLFGNELKFVFFPFMVVRISDYLAEGLPLLYLLLCSLLCVILEVAALVCSY